MIITFFESLIPVPCEQKTVCSLGEICFHIWYFKKIIASELYCYCLKMDSVLLVNKKAYHKSIWNRTNQQCFHCREREGEIEWLFRIDRFKMKGFGLMAQTTVCVWEKERENILKPWLSLCLYIIYVLMFSYTWQIIEKKIKHSGHT